MAVFTNTTPAPILDIDQAADYVERLPRECLLRFAVGTLTTAHDRQGDAAHATENLNCLVMATLCLQRLLDGPELVAVAGGAR